MTAVAEFRQPVRIVAGRADQDEHRQAQAELFGVDQRDAAGDDAVILEPPHAPPAGIARKADAFRKLVDRQRAVALQFGQDSSIDRIDIVSSYWDECPTYFAICKDRLGPMNLRVGGRILTISNRQEIFDMTARLARLFTDHPATVDETYLGHMAFAGWFASRLFMAGVRRAHSRFVALPVRDYGKPHHPRTLRADPEEKSRPHDLERKVGNSAGSCLRGR